MAWTLAYRKSLKIKKSSYSFNVFLFFTANFLNWKKITRLLQARWAKSCLHNASLVLLYTVYSKIEMYRGKFTSQRIPHQVLPFTDLYATLISDYYYLFVLSSPRSRREKWKPEFWAAFDGFFVEGTRNIFARWEQLKLKTIYILLSSKPHKIKGTEPNVSINKSLIYLLIRSIRWL